MTHNSLASLQLYKQMQQNSSHENDTHVYNCQTMAVYKKQQFGSAMYTLLKLKAGVMNHLHLLH